MQFVASNFPSDFDDQFDARVGGYTPVEIWGDEYPEWPDEDYEPEDDPFRDDYE